ncbi:MAG: hypothetical protein GXW89_17475 [Phycisphaerae bacterium]|nr:hypothetical protein [Phycisphaerae bacterium]
MRPAAPCEPAPAPALAPATPATKPAATGERNFARWEKAIAAFEAQDRESPPPKGGVLFIGSSTIRGWKTLQKDFPNHQVINRGFGGSWIMDATHFAERIIFPYEPRMIILRAGSNDIHAGRSPEDVFGDFKEFVAKVHARLPKTTIVYTSINSTPSRWASRDAVKAVNAMIEKYTRGRRYLKYVETYDMVLGPDGQPRAELFLPDRLHFNAEGYQLLAERIRPVLEQ